MTRKAPTLSWLDRITSWSPALLLGLLAALTYWLDAQVEPPAPRLDGSQRHDTDLYVEGFRAVTLDAQGQALQSIAGKAARHFGDDQSTDFIEPMLAQTETGKPAFSVTAASGWLSGDRKEMSFTGNVRAVREAGPAQPGDAPIGPVTVTTEFLRVIPDSQIARTDLPVTIEEPRGIIKSIGLVLDHRAKTLKLGHQVQGTLQPQNIPLPVRSAQP
jgi:lipopolysaccharide export system protein LptC